MDTPDTYVCGIQFAPDAAGRRSSTTAGRDIAAAALLPLAPEASTRAGHERDWRHRYPQHLRRLVKTQAARPGLVLASFQAGLDAAWNDLHVVRGGQPITLRRAMATPTTSAVVAALWVHDLRNPASTVCPVVALAHPLQLLVDGANHRGLWRSPWLPRSVLPMPALRGLQQS